MWTCTKCKRAFRNTNQAHTCKVLDPDQFFIRRPAHFKDLYELLKIEVGKFGEFQVEAVPPDVIFFKTKSTFLALKVKSKWMDVEFFLDHLEDVPPVKKYLQTSRHRFFHVVSIDCKEDIDDQLLAWMRYSYELITTA